MQEGKRGLDKLPLGPEGRGMYKAQALAKSAQENCIQEKTTKTYLDRKSKEEKSDKMSLRVCAGV